MMPVRQFKATNTELTVELINHQWMVIERTIGDELGWHPHSGPYPSMGEAIDWIKEMKEPEGVTGEPSLGESSGNEEMTSGSSEREP